MKSYVVVVNWQKKASRKLAKSWISGPTRIINLQQIGLLANAEDEDSAVLAQLENVIAQKLKKTNKESKKNKAHHKHPEPPDPTLLCVPGKKSHVQRLEKSHQDFKPSAVTDAQVS